MSKTAGRGFALGPLCAGLVCLLLLLAGPVTAQQQAAPGRPYVAIIIDDMGYSWANGRRVLELPIEVTASILPNTPHARRLAKLSALQGREAIVHLPMQSKAGLPLGASAVTVSMAEPQVRSTVEDALAAVPGAIGLGNHMGSLATADPVLMATIMRTLGDYPGLIYVDSRTSPESIAFRAARWYGLRTVRRDVFLDHERDLDQIGGQFERLLHRARLKGHALGIGHPVPSTLDVLDDLAERLEIEGIELVALSEYERRQRRLAPANLTAGTPPATCNRC